MHLILFIKLNKKKLKTNYTNKKNLTIKINCIKRSNKRLHYTEKHPKILFTRRKIDNMQNVQFYIFFSIVVAEHQP